MKDGIIKRLWLLTAIWGTAGLLGATGTIQAEPNVRIKAVAFDAFVVFDPRPLSALIEKLFPGKGADLLNAWRTRQFEYTWLRTISGTYKDFWKVTGDALDYAATTQKLNVTKGEKSQLMAVYKKLKPWPDVVPVLTALKKDGVRLVFLTNFTDDMLANDIKSSGLNGLFEYELTTDTVKNYKPDPKAYQMAIDALHLKKDEILFAAFAGWDAAGAQIFGYPTFWVNRLRLPMEELGVKPKGEGASLTDMMNFLKKPSAVGINVN